MDSLTLTGLLKKAASEFPSRRALSVSGKFDLTHARLNHLVDHAASCLLAAGVAPGDVVAVTFPNTAEFVVAFLAVIRCRATAAPLNLAYTAEEFGFYISHSEAKLLITGNEGNKSAESAASKLRVPHVTATLNDGESELSLSPSPDVTAESNSVAGISNDPSDVALFLHTSGTTSLPKGVPLTQLSLASSARNIVSAYKFSESDGYLHLVCLLKELTHLGGHNINVSPALEEANVGMATDVRANGQSVDVVSWENNSEDVITVTEAADVEMTIGVEAADVLLREDDLQDVITVTEAANVGMAIGIEAADVLPKEDDSDDANAIRVTDLGRKIGPQCLWALGCSITALVAIAGLPIFGHRLTLGICAAVIAASFCKVLLTYLLLKKCTPENLDAQEMSEIRME